MAYNVYSLPDTRTVLYHPDVGTANNFIVRLESQNRILYNITARKSRE